MDALSSSSRASRWEPLLAIGGPALLFAGLIGGAGIWDPYELNVADLGRRAAIHVLGGQELALPGAENRIPTLGDVGRSELPVMSIALALRIFGLREWAGRLPMALWGAAGVAVLWLWLRRMISPRAGTYGALALATMPLYFVHARTMLGDIVTMASLIAAFAGLSAALLDPEPRGGKGGWLLLGVAGMVAGFFCRGALIGAAVPALAVGGVFWLAAANEGEARGERWQPAAAASLLLGGAAAAAGAVVAYHQATPGALSRWLGSAVLAGQRYPTFDAVATTLGHALFPWSAFLPVALGRLLGAPVGAEGAALLRERRMRALLVVGAALAYGAHGWLAPRVGLVPFSGAGLLAAMAALVFLDFERGAHPSRALAVASCALAVLLYADYTRIPDKGMAVFGVAIASFPESFRAAGAAAVAASLVLFASLLLLAFFDGHEPYEDRGDEPWYRRFTAADEVRALLRELNEVWQGNLAFVGVMFEAMLVGVGALLFLGDRFHWRLALRDALSAPLRMALMNAWWLLPLGLLAAVFGLMTARHGFRLALERLRIRRAWVAAASGVGAGLVMALGYYPALASQLSPREVFESYRRMKQPDEPLGLLSVAGRSAAYYTGGEAVPFVDPGQAFSWLVAGPERRWLAARMEDLPRLNSLFRAHSLEGKPSTPDHNLPVLDARSSQIVLVSGALRAAERNSNPFASFLSTVPPAAAHPVAANLNDELEALGWDVFDGNERAAVVVPGKTYTLRLYWRVLAPLTTQWKSFIHIDGFGRRYNGDHDLLEGKYPMNLWQRGDIVTDPYEFKLEPNFSPGNYALYYGFFVGERRLQVKTGKHHENRVEGGPFAVR